MKLEEAFYKECFEEDAVAKNPYILLDKNCLVPIEMFNSVLHRMNSDSLKKKINNAKKNKKLWNILFAAFKPKMD